MSLKSDLPTTEKRLKPAAPHKAQKQAPRKKRTIGSPQQKAAEHEVEKFQEALGPFVVAAEATRMAMVFTNAIVAENPIIFVNDSFLALTGYTFDDVVGQPFNFLSSRVADPNTFEKIQAQFHQETTETIEAECRRKEGHLFLAAIRINPVRDKQGKTVQHFISFVNLSGHVERVRKERLALQMLYQHTPDFIVTTEGPDHRFTFANDTYQCLVGKTNLVGRTVAQVLPELEEQGFISLLNDVYKTGRSFTGESMPIILHQKTGTKTHFLDFIYQPILSSTGAVTGVFCEGHEVTAEKKAREEVELLQAELNQQAREGAMSTMVATIAHELNQPLTVISNYVDACELLIAAPNPNHPLLAQAIKGIGEGARRTSDIIRRLREMTERRIPRREFFDIRGAIEEAVQLVRAGGFATSSIGISVDTDITLEGDRVQIQQVIINLVRNACQVVAEKKRGAIKITTSVVDSHIIISVRDNGPGVAPDKVLSLFEWASSTKLGGMGIGLSICRTIIEAHKGKIWLENNDKGADFCFSLPIVSTTVPSKGR